MTAAQSEIRQGLRVWCLFGHKAGDNNQVLALAEALDIPFEIKQFCYRKTELLTNLTLKSTLAGIKTDQSSELKPPWPDIVISAGRRNEPVAQWIKNQSDNKSRLIHLGRPWASLDRFDLIITTHQYQLPQAENILFIDTVLHRVTRKRLAEAESRWRAEITRYPPPYLAVLVGGNSGAYHFSLSAAADLAESINELAGKMNATALISTSARTPDDASRILQNGIKIPNFFYDWRENQQDNPYMAFLSVADAFIVSGESVSMITEACVTGKPVYMFDFGKGSDSMQYGDGDPGTGLIEAAGHYTGPDRKRILLHKLAMRLGPNRMQRRIRAVHQAV
ncbi:MAG: mitochondrial fission ELM1 family protein, partial [Gammaproteobacteria bacterium]|nr:mitochondrial fission ELM1 family protein [Gammaproteobacteria bacterium]